MLAVAGAAGLGAGSFALAGLGSCHDSGGFCAGSFGTVHGVLYTMAVLVLVAAGALGALAPTRRGGPVAATGSTAGLLLLLGIVLLETTR